MSEDEDEIKAAFQRGLTAARQAQTLLAELNGAISDFGRRINEASDGSIVIAFDETLVERLKMMSKYLDSKLSGSAPEMLQTKAIFAYPRYRTPEGKVLSGNRVQLCIVSLSRDVFPVQLDWDGETIICHNVSDVLQGLEVLAADSRTGAKFLSVMAEYSTIVANASRTLPPAGE